jgi:hypothetical protein
MRLDDLEKRLREEADKHAHERWNQGDHSGFRQLRAECVETYLEGALPREREIEELRALLKGTRVSKYMAEAEALDIENKKLRAKLAEARSRRD